MLQPLPENSAMYICSEGFICRECVEPSFNNPEHDYSLTIEWAISGNYGSRNDNIVEKNSLDEYLHCVCCFRELQDKSLLTREAREILYKQEAIASGINIDQMEICDHCGDFKVAFYGHKHEQHKYDDVQGKSIVTGYTLGYWCIDCAGLSLADEVRYSHSNPWENEAKEFMSEFYKRESCRVYKELLPKLNDFNLNKNEIERAIRVFERNEEYDQGRRYDECFSFSQSIDLLKVLLKVLG